MKNLSVGMKRRLSIAMSLLGDPKVLIFDEPTTSTFITLLLIFRFGSNFKKINSINPVIFKINKNHHSHYT